MITHTSEMRLPAVVQLDDMSPGAFIGYYRRHSGEIADQLTEQGAVKFKGVQIETLDCFQRIVDAIADKFLNYVDGNSPRTKLSGNVYTSTEYDASQRITMHNELSYSAKWPGKLFFSCLKPAVTGGETLLADSREILQKMDKGIVAEIRARGVTYIRNLHSGDGMGPSWQDTFEADKKEQVDVFCRAHHMDFEWRENGHLRLRQTAPGIITHRTTHEEVWFNQIDQFHPSHLGGEILETIQLLYGEPENFPMYVEFGDGAAIDEALIREILRTIDTVTMAPSWETNEFLVVDNELVSHGRNVYTGSRKVLVAMSE